LFNKVISNYSTDSLKYSILKILGSYLGPLGFGVHIQIIIRIGTFDMKHIHSKFKL